MDRPLGPRQPDNKRHTAFQDIFGRSTHTAAAANPNRPGGYAPSIGGGVQQQVPGGEWSPGAQPGPPVQVNYGAYPAGNIVAGPSHSPYPQQQQQYGYAQSQAGGQGGGYAESTYAGSVYGAPYAQQAPIAYHQPQQYYPQQQQQAQSQQYYPQYAQSTYAASTPYVQAAILSPLPPQQSNHLAPSSAAHAHGQHGRTRSVASSRQVQGAIVPHPEEPPDPQLEALVRAGMTPAQAYQQQVYQQHHPSSQSQPHLPHQPHQSHQSHQHQHHASPHSSQPHSPPIHQQPYHPPHHSHNSAKQQQPTGVTHDVVPPKIGLAFEGEDGRLGIDFGDENGTSSGDTDDSLGHNANRRSSYTTNSSTPLKSNTHHQNNGAGHADSNNNNRSPSMLNRRKSSTKLLVDTQMPAVTYSPASSVSHATTSTSGAASSTGSDFSTGTTSTSVTSAASVNRRSTESTRTVPGLSGNGGANSIGHGSASGGSFRRKSSYADRSRSMSAAMTPSIRSMFDSAVGQRTTSPGSVKSVALSHGQHPHSQHGHSTPTSQPANGKVDANRTKTPLVYPALLSRVAQAFRERIVLGDRVKDGLTYTGAFDGREAVDRIAGIIKTSDRNLALLLGRALDAQKFFHDVTYDHRLRDSAGEVYQFRTTVKTGAQGAYVDDEEAGGMGGVMVLEGAARPGMSRANGSNSTTATGTTSTSIASPPLPDPSVDGHDDHAVSPSTPAPGQGGLLESDSAGESAEDELPSGVFTLLTDCYSATCSRDQLCYSIACPRRLEQQARLNLKPAPGLRKQASTESVGEGSGSVELGALWIHIVPKEIADALSDTEKKRQEAINEIVYTEHDFVRDMEYLRDAWIGPLKAAPDVLPEARRTDFLEQVFWNVHDIIAVNTRLRDALKKRQKAGFVVERIGDVLADAVPHFGPFVSYGAHQLYGKFEFEREKAANPAFAAFVEETERRPESRRLELNGYLTKPTTRLARYPLLLDAVLKHTPEDHPDRETLPQVIALVREFLGRVNEESGKTENRFNLLQLDQQLVFRPNEQVDLRLREEGRELVYKGLLKRRGNVQNDSGDLQVFLFDHAVLMVKQKTKHEQYKVYRRPIPLELLVISYSDEQGTVRRDPRARHSTTPSRSSFSKNGPYPPMVPTKVDGKGGFSITFAHLGKKFYQMTLYAPTAVSQRKWIEHIGRQQDAMRDRSGVFDTDILSEGFFTGMNKVNCAAPFAAGRRMVYGTDDGVYMSDVPVAGAPSNARKEPVKMLALSDVTQIDVLEEYQLLLVLSERQVFTFPMDALDPHDPMAGLKRAKRISSHTTFFKAGYCLNKAVVCVVKSSPLSSTIKALEPIAENVRGRAKPTFKKLLQGGNDTLRVYREFYIPVESSSIHYMKTRLIVGCTKGFEIVDLETLHTQGLLNPADESLGFVSTRETPPRPMAIFRIDSDFLLCYDEFAFYINRDGFRSRQQFMVHWEGQPTGFAIQYPYVLAFEPTFVEIRHVETGAMAQIIQGHHLRLLFADMPPSATNSAATSMGGGSQLGHGANAYGQQQPGYNQYNQYAPYVQQQQPYVAGSVGSWNGAGGASGSSVSVGGYNQYGQPVQQQRASGYGRDEIVFVSDDRVMTIKLVGGGMGAGPGGPALLGGQGGLQLPGPSAPGSDATSVYSMAR